MKVQNGSSRTRPPRHRRLYNDAVDDLEGVIDSVEWQRENIDGAFRDRSPAAQPPAPSGNRNHQISRERLRESAQKLRKALVEVGTPYTTGDADELIRLLAKARRFEDESWELDRSANLDGKEAFAEEVLEFAEEVDDYLTDRE